jgi:hypothetical protein
VVICPISESTKSRQVACGDDAPVGYGGVERSRVVEQGVIRDGLMHEFHCAHQECGSEATESDRVCRDTI